MDPQEQDELWNLLGKTSPKKASGAFVQNTLREVRKSQSASADSSSGWLSFFRSPVFAGSLAALVIATLGILAIPSSNDGEIVAEIEVPKGTETTGEAVSEEEVDVLTEELEVLTMVSEFLAVSDPTYLDDAALAELLF